MVPLSNLITALAVVRNGVPKMKGLFSSSLLSRITKSTWYTCSTTSTKMSSAIPKGAFIPFRPPMLPALKVVKGEILNDFLRFISILIAEFAAGDAVNLALKMKGDMMMKGDMIIKNLDLKPTIDAMMRDFLEISLRRFAVLPRWKELNKETSSKILPCGDGSCVGSDPQTEFRGIAIAMFCANLMVRSQMRLPNIVPYGELNGVPVALVARFGVLSKSADRILVSHGG
ncbi:hypothetical protein Tco_0474659 [Tanacetum coccineum]